METKKQRNKETMKNNNDERNNDETINYYLNLLH